jgi:hypothetical protein
MDTGTEAATVNHTFDHVENVVSNYTFDAAKSLESNIALSNSGNGNKTSTPS